MKQQAVLNRISWTSPSFLLLVLGATVIAIHLTLIFKIGSPDRQITSFLFWATAAHLIWERREGLSFKTGLVATVIGSLLLSLLLLKSTGYCEESFLIGFPFIAGIALALIAAGFNGLKIYWREIVLMFFLGIPEVLFAKLFDTRSLRRQTSLGSHASLPTMRRSSPKPT